MKQRIETLFQHSFVRYVLIGGTTVAIDVGLLIVLKEFLHVPIYIAASLSYWTSILFNFLANKHWTFQVSGQLHRHALQYLLLLVFNYLVTLGIIWFFRHLGIGYLIAKMLAIAISISWTYFIYKHVIFKLASGV